MSKLKFWIVHITAIFSAFMLMIGLFYGIAVAEHFRILMQKPIYLGFFIYFSCNVLYFIVFMIWVAKTKQGKIYDKMQAELQQSRIDKQVIEDITGTDYYKTLPKYIGSETFTIGKKAIKRKKFKTIFVSCLSALIILTFIVFLASRLIIEAGLFMPILLLLIMLIIILFVSISKEKYNLDEITIDNKGVTLNIKHTNQSKKRTFTWAQIKGIAISTDNGHRRIENSYIYFKKKEIKGDRCIPEYSDKPHTIMLKYRPEVIHCILNYWNKEIWNLEAMKSWKKYIDNL